MTNVTGYNNTGTIKGNHTTLTTTNDLELTVKGVNDLFK